MKNTLSIITTLCLLGLMFTSCNKEENEQKGCPGNRGGISSPITYWFWTYESGSNITIRVYDEDGNVVTSGFQSEKVLTVYHYPGHGPSSCESIDTDNVSYSVQAGQKTYKWYAESATKSYSGTFTTDCDGGGCQLIEIK